MKYIFLIISILTLKVAVMVESEAPPSAQMAEMAPPEMMADDFVKTLENSPEWIEMNKSLEQTLAQFNQVETKDVVDIPLIKGLFFYFKGFLGK